MRGAYLLILTTPVLRNLQRFTIAAGNNIEGVHDFIPDARREGVGVCDNTMSNGSGFICGYYKFLLEAGD